MGMLRQGCSDAQTKQRMSADEGIRASPRHFVELIMPELFTFNTAQRFKNQV
jgi:hypothetical protein